MVIVEECLELDLGSLVEDLVSVKPVLVGLDVAGHHELEDVGEEVDLVAHRLYRVVEAGVGVVVEVELAIDIAAPHDIFGHAGLHREGNLGSGRDGTAGGGGGLLLGFAFGGLGGRMDSHHSDEKDK